MKIILYSNDCPRCKVLKKKLKDNGVMYTENSDIAEMLSLGITQVPVLEVDGSFMDYTAAMQWADSKGGFHEKQ